METNSETTESQGKIDPAPSQKEGQTGDAKKTIGRRRWIIIGLVLLILGGLFVAKWAQRFNPEHYKRLMAEVQIDMSRNQWDQAAGKLEQIVRHDPDLVDARFSLAHVYLKMQKLASAAREFEEVVRRNPENPQPHFFLGVTYQMMDQYELALKQYRIVAEKNPKQYGVFMNVGLIHHKTKNYTGARKAFEHVIRLKPDYYAAYFRLADVYVTEGKTELAVKEYQTVKKLVGKSPEADEVMKEADRRLALLTRKTP